MQDFTHAAYAIRERIGSRRARLVACEKMAEFGSAVGIPFVPWVSLPSDRVLAAADVGAGIAHCFGDLGAQDVLVVLLPGPPALGSLPERINFQVLSRTLIDHMAVHQGVGGKIVVLSESALEEAGPLAFGRSVTDTAAIAQSMGDSLRASSMAFLEVGGRHLPIADASWEIETTDLDFDQIVQLPGGEIFSHFDCTWDATLPFHDIEDGAWSRKVLILRHGEVAAVRDEEGNAVPSAILGRRITEIGIGANPGVTFAPAEWTEKALGLVHLGLGTRMAEDLAPRDVHFDIILPAAAIVLEAPGVP